MRFWGFIAAIFTTIGSVSASAADDISFSQLSKMKDDASRVGTFLAILSDCQSDERYINIIKETISSLGMSVDIISSDEAKEIIVNSLENSGLDLEKLTILDDIIRARQGEMSGQISAALKASAITDAYKQANSICVAVVTNSPLIKSPENLPDDAPGRMDYYARVSPLSE